MSTLKARGEPLKLAVFNGLQALNYPVLFKDFFLSYSFKIF